MIELYIFLSFATSVSRLNSCSIFFLPSWLSFAISAAGELINCSIFTAISAAFPSSANSQWLSSGITSGMPECLVDTQGRPIAIASINTTGIPSLSPSAPVLLQRIKASEAAICLLVSSCDKAPRKLICCSPAGNNLLSSCSWLPVPIIFSDSPGYLSVSS